MTRYNFDLDDGTVDEIDIDEEVRRMQDRDEAAAEEYEAFLEREYAQTNEQKAANARAMQSESDYWRDLEWNRYQKAKKLMAQAGGEEW